MLLAVDIGNTSIDLGLFDQAGVLRKKGKLSAHRGKSADEYAVIIAGILELRHINAAGVTDCILSSVVPSLTTPICGALQMLFSIKPILIGPGVKTGLNIRIDSQSTLGADLVSNAVGALSLGICVPLVIVDIGSATTFTVIDHTETLIGVIICPGVRTSLDALSAAAAELPDVSMTPPRRLIAKNTEDAMNAGALYGHAVLLDGFAERIREELKAETLHIVVTGGLSSIILPYCRTECRHLPDLTLIGLWHIWQKNKR